MELTDKEKAFIVEFLSKVQFGIEGIDQAIMARDIKDKLASPEPKK